MKNSWIASVTLKEIPDSDGKVGLGITYSENVTIKTEPIVKINSEDIGGPSAGSHVYFRNSEPTFG